MKPVYSLTLPGNSTLEISHDELRSLLGDIESELHRSKVYRRAMAMLQKMLGDSAEQAKQLFKVVGREAIGLTFQHFAQHQSTLTEHSNAPEIGTDDYGVSTQSIEKTDTTEIKTTTDIHPHNESSVNDLSECLASQKFQTINLQSHTETKTTSEVGQEKSPSVLQWFKHSSKPSKAELEEQAKIARIESLRRIGKQLQQARQSQGLNLNQLHVYTHIPIHQMESIENGNWEQLPEEVFVRGFIRVMGNSLGLNGTYLAASLPAPESPQNFAIAPYNHKSDQSRGFNLEINPMHLYVGYTAVVASAVGGLSLFSQYTEAQKLIDSPSEALKPQSTKQSVKETQPQTKPGLQSNRNGIRVGNDISPPEAL